MSYDDERSDWQAVTARSLAYLCLQNSDLKNDTLTTRAKFLMGLGLSTADAAAILNTTQHLFSSVRLEMRREGSVARKNVPEDSDIGSQLRRIANLLGLLATKEMSEAERVGTLNAAGFSNVEIANLLGKDANAIGVALFNYKKGKKKRR